MGLYDINNIALYSISNFAELTQLDVIVMVVMGVLIAAMFTFARFFMPIMYYAVEEAQELERLEKRDKARQELLEVRKHQEVLEKEVEEEIYKQMKGQGMDGSTADAIREKLETNDEVD